MIQGPATPGVARVPRSGPGWMRMTDETRAAAEQAIGYSFKDPAHLALALTHASVAESRLVSNERLEFLGDSVLGLVVSARIFRRFTGLLEGDMTKIKSTAVSRQTCAMIARSLGLDEMLNLGKGMRATGNDGVAPQSLAAAVFESIIAAIYLDGGYEVAEAFILPLLDPLLERAAASGHQENFKSALQQHAQQYLAALPMYRILDEKGPDHAKCFKIAVEIGGRKFAPSWGQSKKQAEQAAALHALHELGVVRDDGSGHVRIVAPGAAGVAVPSGAVSGETAS